MKPKAVNYGGTWYLVQKKGEDVEMTPLDPDRSYDLSGKTENQRSTLQNASMHKYFGLVSESLNSSGFSLQQVVAKFNKSDIWWSMHAVKDVIWKNMQSAIVGKESTTQLESNEVTTVYKYTDHYLTNTIGIEHIPFPSIESMIMDKMVKELEQ